MTISHLTPAETLYATSLAGDPDSALFRADLQAGLTLAQNPTPLLPLSTSDVWAQDFFETGYMTMPAKGAPHVMPRRVPVGEHPLQQRRLSAARGGTARLHRAPRPGCGRDPGVPTRLAQVHGHAQLLRKPGDDPRPTRRTA